MKIKIYYRKNLKLPPQKLAAVCTHIGKELGIAYEGENVWQQDKVVVLSASDVRFKEHVKRCEMSFIYNNGEFDYHVHVDSGFTEVEAGTACAVGWIEWED